MKEFLILTWYMAVMRFNMFKDSIKQKMKRD